jgi:cystathionine gamma-synthase
LQLLTLFFLLFMNKKQSVSSHIIHNLGQKNSFSAVVEPIVMSTTFVRDPNGNFPEGRDIYSRASNPNRKSLELKLALLEQGKEAACFSSGQAATMSIFHSLGANSHIILPDDIYYGTKVLIEKLYINWGLSYSAVDMTDIEAINAAIQPNTKLIWIESPSNPQLKITDIVEVCKLAHIKGLITACDNTWATSFFTLPFTFGVDLVMHSTTKYLGGHSDIIGGVVISKDQSTDIIFEKIREFQTLGGAVPSTQDCWLLSRSLTTFHVRMPIHAQNAMQLALYLEKNPNIEKVYYPGLESDSSHLIAKKQMINGFGGMLSILIKGNEQNCLRVASKLKVLQHATSLGGVESLVDHRKSAEGQHSTSPANLLRVSVGLEPIEDLIEDFKQALL